MSLGRACFWDPFGIQGTASGIAHYGLSLRAALQRRGFTLTVVPSAGKSLLERIKLLQGQRNYNYLLTSSPPKPPFIYHGLANFNLPLWKRRRSDAFVITVHDIIPLLDPRAVSSSYYVEFSLGLRRALSVAHSVIAVSQWTAQHLRERYPWCAHKVVVMRHGLDWDEGSYERQESKKQGQTTQLLSVGRYERYKRFDLLLTVLRGLGPGYQLAVVTNDKGVAFLSCEGQDLIAQGRLQILTKLSQAELSHQYRSADLLVHPSLYEGFCLPAAEALALGLPLVYQGGTAIEEFVPAGLGRKIDTSTATADEWLAAIHEWKERKISPQYQRELAQYHEGYRTWDDVAGELLKVYEGLN